jgi:hypothetical protein
MDAPRESILAFLTMVWVAGGASKSQIGKAGRRRKGKRVPLLRLNLRIMARERRKFLGEGVYPRDKERAAA